MERRQHAMSREDITPAIIRADLTYDPITGVFTWAAVRVGVTLGKRVGTVNKHGYVVIPLRRVQFHAHRVAWAHYYGEWPAGQIDHINGDKADNRICNLRPASPSQNKANTTAQKNSAHRIKGAFWSEKDQRWIVRIQRHGKRLTVGSFATKAEAAAAYDRASLELFGPFARGNSAANVHT